MARLHEYEELERLLDEVRAEAMREKDPGKKEALRKEADRIVREMKGIVDQNRRINGGRFLK